MCGGHTLDLYKYEVWQLNISGFGISEIDPFYVSNECGMTNILFQIVNTVLSQVYSNVSCAFVRKRSSFHGSMNMTG